MAAGRRSVIVFAALVAIAVPAAATGTRAASAIKLCPKITAQAWKFPGSPVRGSTYGSYVVGGYTCAKAASWIKKLTPTVVKNKTIGSSNVLTNGPAGFKCTANPDANGHAFAGSCRKGKLTATVGFGWGSRP
jgi:hypothetical protein